MSENDRWEQQWNRVHLALAVGLIGEMYHSGQWSKGYAKLCQAQRVLGALEFRRGAADPEKWPEVRSVAAQYLFKHRREVAREW